MTTCRLVMTYVQLIMTLCFWFALRKSSAAGNSKPPKAPGPRAGHEELARAITKQDGEWELKTATEGLRDWGGIIPYSR